MTLLVKFPYKYRFFRSYMLLPSLLLILTLFHTAAKAAAATGPSSRKVLAEFEHNGRLNLSHVAVDLAAADVARASARRRWHSSGNGGGGGDIYLAGGNVLYQLDSKLRLKHRIETGNLFCAPTDRQTSPSLKFEIT